jgi:colanic acid biosynthesis glycosyl transferase WcaI
VLLINERGSVVDMSLPSKLTSYLVAGRPIVAAVNPTGQTGREVVRTGAGLAVPADDPQALFAAIRDLVTDDPRIASLAQHGATYARDHLSAPAALARAESFVLHLLNTTTTAVARGDPADHLATTAGMQSASADVRH